MINDTLAMQTLLIGNEQNKVLCFDNFLANPAELVDYARQASFSPYAAAAQRQGYPGMRTAAPADFGRQLRSRVGDLVKSEFAIPAAASITPLQDALCLMTVPEAELGPLQRVPHFDASNPQFFATLLYLCGEEHGGTGFYRHNSTGYEVITPDRRERYLDSSYEELNSQKPARRYFSESNEFFTRVEFIPARFNRLVVYRGCVLHSANIVSALSLNPDPSVGRLTANIFFSFD